MEYGRRNVNTHVVTITLSLSNEAICTRASAPMWTSLNETRKEGEGTLFVSALNWINLAPSIQLSWYASN